MKEKSRIDREKQTVELMVRLYCRKQEKNAVLCPECQKLIVYARQRLEHCPFGEGKTSCKRCPVHCYQSVFREKMRAVMRFAGPRMVWYYPGMAFRHFLER